MGPSFEKLYDVDNMWEQSMEDRVDFIYALQRKIMKENIDKFTKLLDQYIEVNIYCSSLRKWGSIYAYMHALT